MKSSKSFFLIALSCLKPNRKVMFQNVAYRPTVYENGCQSLIFLHYKSRMTNTFQEKYLQTMGLKDFSVFFYILDSLMADSALLLFRDTKTGSNLKAFMFMTTSMYVEFLRF